MCRCQRIRDQKFECTHQNSPEIHGKQMSAPRTAVVDDGVGFGAPVPGELVHLLAFVVAELEHV